MMSLQIRGLAAAGITLIIAGQALGQATRFAVLGDFGQSSNSQLVANRINAMAPDFVATTGDNTYSTSTNAISNYDSAVGQYYRSYIQLPAGSAYAGQGAATNNFFPSMGNHDWDVGNNSTAFRSYFTLPGNERYYTVTRGSVQLFVLSSDTREPDGVTVGSTQYNWFRSELSASTARWQVVLFHHPFQTSNSTHGPATWMNWGFENLGVDMVMSGHNHFMERLSYGGIPWIVTGAGGRSHYSISTPASNSIFRNTTDYGFSMVTADQNTLTHQFINTNGTVLDTFTVPTPGAATLLGLGLVAASRRRR